MTASQGALTPVWWKRRRRIVWVQVEIGIKQKPTISRPSRSWAFRLYRFLLSTFRVVGENDQVARRWLSSAFRAFFPSFSLGIKRFIRSHPFCGWISVGCSTLPGRHPPSLPEGMIHQTLPHQQQHLPDSLSSSTSVCDKTDGLMRLAPFYKHCPVSVDHADNVRPDSFRVLKWIPADHAWPCRLAPAHAWIMA